jgi:hypothetical protein
VWDFEAVGKGLMVDVTPAQFVMCRPSVNRKVSGYLLLVVGAVAVDVLRRPNAN